MASQTSIRNSKTHHTVIETAPKATLLMLLAGLFILFIGALLICGTASPTVFSAPAAFFALYTGSLLGGLFCSSKLDGALGLTGALIASALLCLLFILTKAFIASPKDADGFLTSLITHLLIPMFSAGGALIGEKSKTYQKLSKRKKHYRSKK